MKRASYREGIQWIANNDEPEESDHETVTEMISVMLLADLFGTSPEEVALDVLKERAMSGLVPVWVPLDLQPGEYFCLRHKEIAADCRCPDPERWTVSPYVAWERR